MQVTIIGSGNVGTVVGRTLLQKGGIIRQVYSRTAGNAAALAAELKAQPVSDLGMIDDGADIYLVTVTDDAIPSIASNLTTADRLVVHTAGSVSKEVLKNVSDNYGILWPVKMIRKNMLELGAVNIVIDGNSPVALRRVEQFARKLSGSITVADDATRVKMHLAAVVASNFTNHLYHLAADYCAGEQIDFKLLYPIIEETARQVQYVHPAEIQAGPAFRGDKQTIMTHLQLLQPYPALKKLYENLSRSIMEKTAV